MYYAIMKEFPFYFVQSASKVELNCVEFAEDRKRFKTRKMAEDYFADKSWRMAVDIKSDKELLVSTES